MPLSPNSINDHIAEAKGWTWRYVRSAVCAWVGCNKVASPDCCDACDLVMEDPQPWGAQECLSIEWTDPKGIIRRRPNYVGTLKGVSGMLRELNKPRSIWDKTHRWLFYWDRLAKQFTCQEELYVNGASPAFRIQGGRQFFSPDDCPADCVGEAYLSVFRKETAGAKG